MFNRLSIFLIIVLQVLPASEAFAATKKQTVDLDPPMHFEIVRSGNSLCEPVCPHWIVATGRITSDSPSKLRKVFEQMGDRQFPIVLNSGGGDVHAAMELGLMIRQRFLDIAIGSTRINQCLPDPNECKPGGSKNKNTVHLGYADSFGYCESACAFILAGGVVRVTGPYGRIGVHQITTTYTRAVAKNRRKSVVSETTKLTPSQYSTFADYFTSMGVNPILLDWMLATSPKDMSYLSPEQALQVKLVSSSGGVDDLTAIKICRTQQRPGNCVEHTTQGSTP